jgi:predicted nucleic acid-binding Zn ribbon protein
MPVVEERTTGGSGMTTLLTFLIGILIVLVVVVIVLHGVLHIF